MPIVYLSKGIFLMRIVSLYIFYVAAHDNRN